MLIIHQLKTKSSELKTSIERRIQQHDTDQFVGKVKKRRDVKLPWPESCGGEHAADAEF